MKKIHPIYETLAHIRSRLVLRLGYETLALVCVAMAVFFFVALPLRYFFNMPDIVFFAVCFLIAVVFCGVWWVDVLRSCKGIFTIERTARFLEQRFASMNGDLISAYQFSKDPDSYNRLGLSRHLVQAHIARVEQSLSAKDLLSDPRSIPHRRFARYWVYLIAVIILPVTVFSDFYARSIHTAYEKFFDTPAQFREIMVVRPGSVTVPYATDVTVDAIVFTAKPGLPSITWSATHNPSVKKTMSSEGRYRYSFTLKDIREPVLYRVDHISLSSQEYIITPASPPVILKHTVLYTYPQYTGYEPKEETRIRFEDITALRGTQITMEVTSNNPLAQAYIYRAKSDSGLSFDIVGNTRARVSFYMDTEDEYRVGITDIHGQDSQQIAMRRLAVIEDQPPSVQILNPDVHMEIPKQMRVGLVYRASDDILLQSAELRYTVSGYEEKVYVLAPAINLPALEQTYDWDLTKLLIAPGDEILYKVRVYDWFPPPEGPHMAESAVHTLKFPSLAEMYKRRTQAFEEPSGEFSKLRDEQTALLEKFQKLTEKINQSESVSWTDKQTLTGLMESQQQINSAAQKQADSLKEQLKQLDVAADVLEKYSEIQMIIDNLLTEEMKETLRKLNEMIEQSESFKELRAQLQDMQADLNQFKENLERTLELLKKLAVQNALQQMAQAAQHALDNQQNLLEQLKQWEDNPQAQPDMNSVTESLDDTERLEQYIDQSVQQLANKNFADEQLQRSLEELRQLWQQSGARDDIADMKQQISSNNPKNARQTGQKNAMSLEEFKKALENLLSQLQKEKKLIADISAMIRRLIRIGDELDGLIASMHRYQGKNAAKNVDHATTMFFVRNELERAAQTVRDMSAQSPVIDPAFAKPMTEIAAELSHNTERVFKRGDQNVIPLIRAQSAQIRYEAAVWVALLEALIRAQQAGAGGGQMPSDLDDFFKQLEQMAQQQAQINQQTGMIPQMGKTPSALQQYLQQLASEQQLLSEALSRLSQGLSGKERVLGDLNDISAQMDKASQQLLQGDIGAELKQRQQNILTRLLEAEKSLTTRDKSKERESKTAGQIEPDEPPEELPSTVSQRESVLRRVDPSYIPPDYRDPVKKYFRLLMEPH